MTDKNNDNWPTDENLILKYQKAGDIDALNTLVQRYFQKTYSFFAKQITNRDDVDDLVQNVFLKLVRNINSDVIIKNFQNYLFTCCRNTFRDYLRRKNTASVIQTSDDETWSNITDLISFKNWGNRDFHPFNSTEAFEKAIEGCISCFSSEKIRNVLSDYVAGYSLKEISCRNNCPVNTAASIWSRKKEALLNCVLGKVDLYPL